MLLAVAYHITFDQTAYTQVTSLKVDALDLMDKASESMPRMKVR